MIVTLARSASYLMVELLNHPEIGIRCDGEILNPIITNSIGFNWRRETRNSHIDFPNAVKKLNQYFDARSDFVAGFKMMSAVMYSPTNRIAIDFMDSISQLHTLFLVRDPFDNIISDLEARTLNTWMVLDESIRHNNFTSEIKGASISAKNQAYLTRKISTQPSNLLEGYLRRCSNTENIIDQANWLASNRPGLSILVHTEEFVNETTRFDVMKKVYSFLLHLEPEDPHLNEIMEKMKPFILKTKNKQGRSRLSFKNRIENWPEICQKTLSEVSSRLNESICMQRLFTRLKSEILLLS